jgi:hypothetical protein
MQKELPPVSASQLGTTDVQEAQSEAMVATCSARLLGSSRDAQRFFRSQPVIPDLVLTEKK